MRTQKQVVALVSVLSVLLQAGAASAQNFSTDARKVGMGGNGGDSANIAAGMVEKGSPYTAIVIPLGIIQILSDGLDRFDPSKSAFDPGRAVEDIANPLHYTFGRGTTDTRLDFVTDIVNGNVSSNFLNYTGFKIPTDVSAEGLASPTLGGTIKLFKTSSGAFQGVYLGVGPYLGFNTEATVDQRLANLLGLGTTGFACAPCLVTNQSKVQLAASITIGYRGRVPLGGDSTRDGVYVAYNHHILRGFKYFNEDLTLRVDTNAAGQLVLPPIQIPPTPQITPVVINSLESSSGKGRASDIGFQVVKGFWEVGFGINGIGNQITWDDFERKRYTLGLLQDTSGIGFVETVLTPTTTSEKVELPVVKTGNIGFQAAGWGARASLTEGYNDKSFNGGLERQVGPLWLRGGGRYSRGDWDPTYGFGIGGKVALDFGFYGTHANLERKRQTAMAVSLRINR